MVVSERLDTNMTFVGPQKAENTDPCTNYAVKYATARGHLKTALPETVFGPFLRNISPTSSCTKPPKKGRKIVALVKIGQKVSKNTLYFRDTFLTLPGHSQDTVWTLWRAGSEGPQRL